ncbi:MAG TPA: hypothetical protein VFJ82_03885 [Longimicrobium sp.]|nr:hypothetical protein [Longimicrobium sp.]
MPTPFRLVRRLALAVPLMAALGACATWSRRPAPAAPHEQFLAGPVRVTRADGSPLVLDRVTFGPDSVIGREHARPHGRVAIPAAEVRKVEGRRVDPLRTSGVAVVSLAALVAVCAAFLVHTDALGN